jgi:micrococcal nuclease
MHTQPGAACTIAVLYKSGASRAAGLDPQIADAQGIVRWSWQVGGRTTVGTWRIMVTARAGDATAAQEIPFPVIR